MLGFGRCVHRPLTDDERAAGDDFARDWPAYVAEVEKVFSLLQAGKANQAADLADGSAIPLYRKTIGELKIMIESNARQAEEVARIGPDTNRQVTLGLIVGAIIAAACSLILGLWVTRMITLPLYRSVASAGRIAQGDLSQTISSVGKDETAQLSMVLSVMRVNLKTTVQQIADASNQLASAAEELSAVTEDSSRGLLRQNDEIQQAATAVNQMTAAVEEVARNRCQHFPSIE